MMLFCKIILFLFLSAAHSHDYFKTYSEYKLYEVTAKEFFLIQVVENMKYVDTNLTYFMGKNYLQILVDPKALKLFLNLVDRDDAEAKLLVSDFSDIVNDDLARPMTRPFTWEAYYITDEIYAFLKHMHDLYPRTTRMITGGSSYEGKNILGLRIHSPPAKGQKPKPVVFIESGIHGREWITPAATTYFINELISSTDEKIEAMREKLDWRIFPVVNPDGYDYSQFHDRMWTKSRTKFTKDCYGVDLNRNWDYNWQRYDSSANPCEYQNYAGLSPFHEIETRTLSGYIASLKNLKAYISFHSNGQMLLIPFSNSLYPVDNYNDLVRIGKKSLQYCYKVNRTRYKGPDTANRIHRKLSGTSMDWVRHTFETPLVYTYHLREENFHWPRERIQEQGQEVTQMMVGLYAEANNLGYFNT